MARDAHLHQIQHAVTRNRVLRDELAKGLTSMRREFSKAE
jgi:hypothetical protein